MERDDEGEKILKSGLKKYPELAALHYSLGLLKVRQSEHAEALAYLANAAKYDPNDPQYSYVYAIGLNSQQQAEEALKVLKEAVKKHPYDRNILYSLSTISSENGYKEDALMYAEKLVENYPEDQNYQQLYAFLSN